ncbi:MAG: hypothetical protein LBN23_08895 [Paludibacter sp.]|jgi:hypothetical protein|nr:hypothetical protein [Paludibacter sp.]
MLKKIITAEQCAACRFCCVFDKDDAWEMPVISDELAREKCFAACDFETKNGVRKVKPQFDTDGLFRCPALGENGCTLADRKPFDCKIWAFRVMRANEVLLLTLSPFCPATNGRTVAEIQRFVAESGIADIAFCEAEKNFAAIPEYKDGYAVYDVRI